MSVRIGHRPLLLTAREESELHQRAASVGADAYLAKPFTSRDLLDHVERPVCV